MNEPAKVLMTQREARDCVEEINAGINNIRELIFDLYEREGWSALGYESWRECAMKEFLYGQSHVYRLLAAAKIERNISPIGEKRALPLAKNGFSPRGENIITEKQLRPLEKLTPSQQREAWQQAIETAPEGKVTAYHVQKVVNKMIGVEKAEKEKKLLGMFPKEVVDPNFQAAWDRLLTEIKNIRALKWKTMSRETAIKKIDTLIALLET